MFSPPMPGDVMVNFYINLSKLCLTVYQLHVLPPNTTKVWTCIVQLYDVIILPDD